MSLFQEPLLPTPMTANIALKDNHDLVCLEKTLNRDELILLVDPEKA